MPQRDTYSNGRPYVSYWYLVCNTQHPTLWQDAWETGQPLALLQNWGWIGKASGTQALLGSPWETILSSPCVAWNVTSLRRHSNNVRWWICLSQQSVGDCELQMQPQQLSKTLRSALSLQWEVTSQANWVLLSTQTKQVCGLRLWSII